MKLSDHAETSDIGSIRRVIVTERMSSTLKSIREDEVSKALTRRNKEKEKPTIREAAR